MFLLYNASLNKGHKYFNFQFLTLPIRQPGWEYRNNFIFINVNISLNRKWIPCVYVFQIVSRYQSDIPNLKSSSVYFVPNCSIKDDWFYILILTRKLFCFSILNFRGMVLFMISIRRFLNFQVFFPSFLFFFFFYLSLHLWLNRGVYLYFPLFSEVNI